MRDEVAIFTVGTLVTLLAITGLFLWARALDAGIAIFGCSLLSFGLAFDFWLIKYWFDRAEAMQAKES